MRDPTPAEWVLGLTVVIGGGIVIAIGAGWYPNLPPGSWAEWVGGIGAILVVLLALFGNELRDWMFGPRLDVAVSTDPPDCVRVDIFNLSSPGPPIDTVYVRMKVRNDGQSLAREVQVFAESLVEFVAGQGWQPVRMFVPGLGPAMNKHCDLGRIAFHGQRHMVGDHKTGLDVNSNAFAFETLVKPNHQGHIVGPGRYLIRLLLAADNARPVVRTIELVVGPEWRPADPATMLAIRVV